MLKPARLGLFLAIFFSYPISNAAAGMNKCTDGKRITYTNESCEALGLNSAGPIKDAVTVLPAAPKPQNSPAEKPGKEHADSHDIAKNDVSDANVSRAATIKPVNPLVNKMLDW